MVLSSCFKRASWWWGIWTDATVAETADEPNISVHKFLLDYWCDSLGSVFSCIQSSSSSCGRLLNSPMIAHWACRLATPWTAMRARSTKTAIWCLTLSPIHPNNWGGDRESMDALLKHLMDQAGVYLHFCWAARQTCLEQTSEAMMHMCGVRKSFKRMMRMARMAKASSCRLWYTSCRDKSSHAGRHAHTHAQYFHTALREWSGGIFFTKFCNNTGFMRFGIKRSQSKCENVCWVLISDMFSVKITLTYPYF